MSGGGDGEDRGSNDRPKKPTSGQSPPPRTDDAEMEWEGQGQVWGGWEGMGRGGGTVMVFTLTGCSSGMYQGRVAVGCGVGWGELTGRERRAGGKASWGWAAEGAATIYMERDAV